MNTASKQQASASRLDENTKSAGASATPPSAEVREAANAKLIAQSGLFDAGWYVTTYQDVVESGLEPALHYVRHGAAEGRSPSPGFDAADYVSRYNDVAKTGMNPLLHYLTFGRREARTVNPVRPIEDAPIGDAPVRPTEAAPSQQVEARKAPAAAEKISREAENLKLVTESGLFDEDWYRQHYMARVQADLSAALHYLRHGGAKGHAPSPAFHAADYLARYKDVREARANPLVHYLRFGKAEKRVAKPLQPDDVLTVLISESGLYDEQWYLATYPEIAKSKLSPLRHFLKHGREKKHHPGPGFDAEAYVAANAEVAASDINPLVHYLQTGKAEGRLVCKVAEIPKRAVLKPKKQAARPVEPQPATQAPAPVAVLIQPVAAAIDISADLALLESTPLFDKAWYLMRYPDSAKLGMSPAEHYLRHGEMRQPSIFFDPQYYVIEESPEIQHTAVNPLLHFLKVGKALGRKPRALFEANPSLRPSKPLHPSSWPLVAAEMPSENMHPWVKHADLKQRQEPGSLFIEGTLIAWSPDPAVLDAACGALAVFLELAGLDRSLHLRLKGAKNGFHARYDGQSYRGLGAALTSEAAAIADAWLTTDRTLRIRFGDNGGEVARSPLVVRAFHVNCGASPVPALAGEALVGTGVEFVDFTLATPFSPLLIVVSKTSGEAVEIALLPFPSLCRGGQHHAELMGSAPSGDPIVQLRQLSDRYVRNLMAGKSAGGRLLSQIAIGITHASGTEKIFSPDMLGWITSVFGVPVVSSMARQPDTPGESYLRQSLAASNRPGVGESPSARSGRFTLELPPDAIPTIAALTARAFDAGPGEAITGSWYVTDAVTGRPRFSVAMPQAAEALLQLQPPWAPQGFPILRRDATVAPQPGGPTGVSLHLAIRQAPPPEATRAAILMPLAPDSTRRKFDATASSQPVDVILRATGIERTETFLRSLLRQTHAPLGQIRIECQSRGVDPRDVQSLADRLIPGRATVTVNSGYLPLGLSSLIAESASAFTLIADDTVVLHDTRTLEALTALAASGKIASASCVLLREAPSRKGTALSFESGGYFPAHVSLLSSPRLMLSLPDCRGALAQMTYPVIANDPALIMLNNEALRTIGAGDGVEPGQVPDSIAFSLHALAAGYRHLCTSALRATAIGMPARQIVTDPPGLASFGPQRWEDILGAITVLRELY